MTGTAAMRAVWSYSVRRGAGVGGPAGGKVLAGFVVAIAFVPAVIAIGLPVLFDRFATATGAPVAIDRVRALTEDARFVPQAGEYLFVVSAAVVLGAAITAPELLGGDRRSGLLVTYLGSPLRVGTYLLAKGLALVTLLSVVTCGPLLLLVAGRLLTDRGPTGPGPILGEVATVLLAGLAVAVAYTAVSMAVTSVAGDRALAAAGIVAVLVVSAALSSYAGRLGGGAWADALSVRDVPFALAQRLLGGGRRLSGLDLGGAMAATAAWTVAAAGVAWAATRRAAS